MFLHHLKGAQPDSLHLVQMTDLHLYKKTEETLLGVNTQKSFDDALALMHKENAHADALLFTGDIAQAASNTIYQRFKQQADNIGKPYFCLAGNHDAPHTMGKFFTGSESHQIIDSPYWQIILLNSHVAATPAGNLTDSSLDWLAQTLKQAKNNHKHCIIFLHHHPIAIDSAWIDNHMLKNADKFWQVIDQVDNVKAICFGHVHQAFHAEKNNVKLYAAPSTSAQFKPKSTDFAVDKIASGYRWFTLYNNGNLETGIKRLHYISPGLQMDSSGY